MTALAQGEMPETRRLTKLKGAPRGLLLQYILHRIAYKPCHGYEILQDIDSKTAGAWRPGAGSIYPILKRLLAEGYLKADEKEEETARRVYSITPKGERELKEGAAMLSDMGQRWVAMSRLFFELIEPSRIGAFIIEGARVQFELAKELVESKKTPLSPSDAEFLLREYAVSLERQLDWTNRSLKNSRTATAGTR